MQVNNGEGGSVGHKEYSSCSSSSEDVSEGAVGNSFCFSAIFKGAVKFPKFT